MKVLFVGGSRNWNNREAIVREIGRRNPDLVIHGGCRGADLMTNFVCRQRGIHTAQIDAIWDVYEFAAGPKRNAIMAQLLELAGRANAEIAAIIFHENIELSKGSKGMKYELETRNIVVEVIEV